MGAVQGESRQILRDDGELLLLRVRGSALDNEASRLISTIAGDAPTSMAIARLEREFTLRDRVDAAWAALPLELKDPIGGIELWLEDPGGDCLCNHLGLAWEPRRFFPVALALVRALRALHGRGLVHRDLRPANLLVRPDLGALWLTGFGIADDAPTHAPCQQMMGTLAYMSPEQTGRMNRPVDTRSDLYSSGITFYEMLTGTLPFAPDSVMEAVHCHLARQPQPPQERCRGIPALLSELVMKLLAKAPEDRYQSAAGLEADLRAAQQALDAPGGPRSFVLGREDLPARLHVTDRLFGRDRELISLRNAYARVAASGRAEWVLIDGQAGVGKSALVGALRASAEPTGAGFASGKFDQYQRDIPYASLADAVQALVRAMLGKSPTELAACRQTLLAAIDEQGQLLITLAPELELVIGPQPAITELTAADAQRRFVRVLRAFLGVFATVAHPLVLFLDDLQWLDRATLDLLGELLEGPSPGHLLLIGAYRDNEVDVQHRLSQTLCRLRGSAVPPLELKLAPLAVDDLAALIAESLRCELRRALPLAHLVHERTCGNPFFTIQFLNLIADEGLISFDPERASWNWDPRLIAAKSITDNVVGLMVERLGRLPTRTQALLRTFACIGSQVSMQTLVNVVGDGEQTLHDQLWSAVQAGLVVPLDSAYAFLHDRVQEAAYALIPPADRAPLHLHVARRLADRTPRAQLEENVFEIASQFDRGIDALEDPDEALRVAELNRLAGHRARQSGAYARAQTYFAAGLSLLQSAVDAPYAVSFDLRFRLAQCEFLTGQAAAAGERLEALSAEALGPVDLGLVTCLRIDLYTSLRRPDLAVEVSLAYLRKVGIEWAPHPSRADANQEFEQLERELGERRIEDLIDLPRMTDPDAQATLDVLTSVQPPALFTDENLHSLVVARMARLSLAKGNSDGSCYAYAVLGVVLGANFNDYARGFRFGKLGHELVEHRGLLRFRARACMSFGAHVNTWSRPLPTSLVLVRQAHAFAQSSGDLSFAAYSWETLITLLLASGTALAEVQREAEAGLEFAQRMGVGLVADIITGQLALIRSLRGQTRDFGSFEQDSFDAARFEQTLDDLMLAFAACWYWIRKLQACVHARDWSTALDSAARAKALDWTSPGHFELAEYHYYAALAQAGTHDQVPGAQARATCRDEVAAHLRQLEIWAKQGAETFVTRAALVAAELARIEDRELDAQRHYEQAIHSAEQAGLVHSEALSCELAGLYYAARGYVLPAQAYLRRSRYAYQRWGADGKVRQLETLHPQLGEARAASRAMSSVDTAVEQLDLATVLKLSQAISGEIETGRLIDTLMVTSLESAGAAYGLLILPRGDRLELVAEARVDVERVQMQRHAIDLDAGHVPLSMVHYSVRTLETVVLDDASLSTDYRADPYFAGRRARSVLCLPLIKQSSLIGVLYLENPLASQVFTASRLAVLKLLASQAAIALENALLFEAKERTEAALRVTEARYLFADAAGYGHTDWIVASDEFYSSPRFLEICGLLPDTRFTGRDDFLARLPLHPEDREQVVRELDLHLRSGLPRIEKELRLRVREETRWVHLSGVYQRDRVGTLLRVTGSYTDVTDRKCAELARKASEERFEMAIAGTSQGVFDWEMSTDQLFLSPRAQAVLGLEPGEPWRSRPDWFSRFHMHAEDYPEYLRSLKSHLANEVPAYDVEYRLTQRDGTVRWYRHRGVALRDAAGRPYRMAGSIEDISDRKCAEEELRRMEKQRRQSQRLEAMGTLAGGIAHDFNNILGAVLGYGEMALRDAAHGSRLRRDLDSIMVAGERGRALVDRILAFSRSGIGERTAVNIAAVVGEALDLIAARLPQNIRIERQIHSGRAALLGDATEVHQVVMNLVTNAVQAMPDGGTLMVWLDLQHRDPPRVVGSETLPPGEYLRLRVTDTGIGIASDLMERIFDPFFTTRESAAGTGLGLSLVHSIVSEIAGAIEVSSSPGQGSTFTVWLPRAGDARTPAATGTRSLALGNGERILIVDDEEPLLRLACESLTELGYETLGFTSGAAALDAFNAAPERFDALITDERMPGMSGTALIRKMRALRETLPVMLVSGFAGRHVARRAREAGADEVLNKPLSRRELSAALQRVLESR
ncbi:MAG: AAA family ATPase [Panacagrimonas sp.]